MKVIYPRNLAVRILTAVLSHHRQLDTALGEVYTEVPSESVAWLQEICSGTLRWKGRLDLILDSVAIKKKPTGWLRKILLLSTYQLVVQDRIHPGMVVSETVAAVRKQEGEAPAKFANACLRKIADHAQAWRALPFPTVAAKTGSPKLDQRASQAQEQARWASLPAWLWQKLVKQQGVEWARDYALASLERPELWIRAS